MNKQQNEIARNLLDEAYANMDAIADAIRNRNRSPELDIAGHIAVLDGLMDLVDEDMVAVTRIIGQIHCMMA